MQRITITMEEDLLEQLDALVSQAGYQNRSEALRDLTRAGLLRARRGPAQEGPAVAALVYVYDHATRELAKRLSHAFHDHHHMAVSTMHVHLDHDSCLEVTILKGPAADIRHFADHVIAERGVRHGEVVMLPPGSHAHADHAHDNETHRSDD
jgi:CopG family nickel-responsive transcriptional regulator